MEPRPQLLVSLANGQLLALDEDTGDLLWTFDTGAPLLSSTNPAMTSDLSKSGVHGDGDDATAVKDGIFPGTDGSLYIYRAGGGGIPKIEVCYTYYNLLDKLKLLTFTRVGWLVGLFVTRV